MLKHPALAPTIFESLPRVWSHPPKPAPATRRRSFLQSRPIGMADAPPPDFSAHGVETTSIPTAAGVSLTARQKLLTGSVLDLFGGRASLRKLALWRDDASFVDPLTIAEGRKQYQAQWYGLAAVFGKIERLGCTVTSGGNPIEMDLKTKYTLKGLGSEQTIASKVLIHTDAAGEKIVKVEDKWDGKLPDGVFVNVSRSLRVLILSSKQDPHSIRPNPTVALIDLGSSSSFAKSQQRDRALDGQRAEIH